MRASLPTCTGVVIVVENLETLWLTGDGLRDCKLITTTCLGVPTGLLGNDSWLRAALVEASCFCLLCLSNHP